MKNAQQMLAIENGETPASHIPALSDASAAIEESIGMAFGMLRELRCVLSAKIDTASLSTQVEELRAAAAQMTQAMHRDDALKLEITSNPALSSALTNLAESLDGLCRDEELCSDIVRVMKPLAQKSGAHLSRLVETTQVRDEAEQRLAHICTGIGLLQSTEPDCAAAIRKILAAQVIGVADSLTNLQAKVSKACRKLMSLITMQETALLSLPRVSVCDFGTVCVANDASRQPGSWEGLSSVLEAFDQTLAANGNANSAQICDMRAELETSGHALANRLAGLANPLHGRLTSSRRLIENFSLAIAGLRAIADDLRMIGTQLAPGENQASQAELSEDPGVRTLWDLYTMAAEREIHSNALRKLSG